MNNEDLPIDNGIINDGGIKASIRKSIKETDFGDNKDNDNETTKLKEKPSKNESKTKYSGKSRQSKYYNKIKFLYERVKINESHPLITSNNIIEQMNFYLPLAFSTNDDIPKESQYIKNLNYCKECLYSVYKKKQPDKVMSVDRINEYLNLKFSDYKPSYNPAKEDELELSPNQLTSSYFTKLLMVIKILFQISLIYKYTYDLGTLKYFITIYRIIVLQFEVENEYSTKVYQINSFTNSMIHIGIYGMWFLSFLYFIYFTSKNKLTISFTNNTLTYNYPKIKKKQRYKHYLFLFSVFILSYFMIPLANFSVSNLLISFPSSNIKFNMTSFTTYISLTHNKINFSIAIAYIAVLVFFIWKVQKILKTNVPLLDPFDALGVETLFHHINCPQQCKGNLISLSKRICWNYAKEGIFKADISRPIIKYNYIEKRQRALLKYYKSIFTIKFILFIFSKGYSFEMKYYYLYFIYINILIVLAFKVPFSLFLGQYSNNNLITRNIISYSISSLISLGRIVIDILYYNKKIFLFKTDTIMNLLIDIIVFIMSVINLVKFTIIGEYFVKAIQNTIDPNSLSYIFEMISFSIVMLAIIILLLFIILGMPFTASLFNDIHLEYPAFASSLKLSSNKKRLRTDIIDFIWKPFWDNLFLNNKEFNTPPNYTDLISGILKKIKQFDSLNETVKNYKFTTCEKLRKLEKDYSKYMKEEKNETINSEVFLLKAESLLRKYLLHNINGRDIFWEGEVIGKRTCKSFFGKIYINIIPFKVFMIYDETSEYVEIPRKEWINLCKINNEDNKVQLLKEIRNKLRCLNGQIISMERKKQNQENGNLSEIEMSSRDELEKITQTHKIFKFKISSADPNDEYSHGFSIELANEKNNSIKSLNLSNFFSLKKKVSDIDNQVNSLLRINKKYITHTALFKIKKKFTEWKYQTNLEKYLNEVTLSSWFYELVYDNQEITIGELIYYLTHFEKRKETKVLPYIYYNQIYQTLVLWEYLRSNSVIAYWYLYWYQFWQENKVLITRFSGGRKRYFDPNYSTSICYCVMDQECLEQFLGSIHLLKYYDSSKIDDLYVTLNLYSEGSMLINRKGLGRVNRNSVSTENPKMYALTKALNENVVKFAKKKNDLDEGEDNVFTHQKNIIKDPYSLYYPSLFKESSISKSYLNFIIPSWKYITYIEDNQLSATKRTENENLFTEYFIRGKIETPDSFFKHLGKNWNLVQMYSENEIFGLVKKENSIKKKKPIIYNDNNNSDTEKETPEEGIGNTNTIEITLPPYFKIDAKFLELPDGYLQKIDQYGRIFYVDTINQTTSFNHPLDEKQSKPSIFKDLLSTKIEPIYYKIDIEDKIRILYVDHENRKTSWVNPLTKKELNFFPSIN